jgi:AhpD family alkylhydroperoxidase
MTQTLETKTTVDRIKIHKTSPELYDAMMALSNAAAKDIDAGLAELIKIRASQINHCAFCLDMHTRDARKHGVSDQKIDVLAAWEEAGGLFTEREKAALALTESMTNLPGGVSDEVYARAAAAFSERELGQVIAMALTINAWNRIGVTTRLPLPKR